MKDMEREALETVIHTPLEDEEIVKEEHQPTWKIIFLCCIWFIISICSTGIATFLFDLAYCDLIATVTMVQFTSMTLYTGLFIIFWGIPRSTKDLPWAKWFMLIIPMILSMFIRIRMDNLMWASPISDPFSLPVEAFVPLCMLILARIILDEKRVPIPYIYMLGILGSAIVLYVINAAPYRIYPSRIPVYAALTSFEMVFSKKILKETGLHHSRLLFVLACTMVITYFPIFLMDTWSRLQRNAFVFESLDSKTASLIILAGVLSWLQTIVAFTLTSMVPTHCYVAASACNRMLRLCTVAGIAAWFYPGPFYLLYAEY